VSTGKSTHLSVSPTPLSTLRKRLIEWPLKKLPISQTSLNPDGSDFRPSPEMEAEFLKHKHLGFQTPEWLDSIGQKPLMGFGGEGRKMPSLSEVDEEAREKFWAMMMGENHNQKRMTKGGHGVPLSSKSRDHLV
jgi:saccharopepsin